MSVVEHTRGGAHLWWSTPVVLVSRQGDWELKVIFDKSGIPSRPSQVLGTVGYISVKDKV